MRKSHCVLVAVAFSLLATTGQAAAWDLIGSRVVTDKVDRDVIYLNGPRRFKEIRFCVFRNPVRFYDVDIRFANGGNQDIKIAKRINPGHCTRAINLRGPSRDIAHIKFIYEEASVKLRRATVRVFGR